MTSRKTNLVQVVASRLREDVKKEAMASMKNVAPGKLELFMACTEPAVAAYIEYVSEIMGPLTTVTPINQGVDDVRLLEYKDGIAAMEREIDQLREALEIKVEKVRILREQALEIASSRS